ncbi:MAG TPA: hypothetical protein VN843_30205 [Anaerolineales bacterium]|nr:hypothetical protein [Anaerolineales bacterium]
MIKGFLNLPWFLWAGIALIIAVIYSFVWPHKAVTGATGFRFFILRWGHALVWILLTINFLLRGIDPSLNRAANLIALLGGLMYLLFIVVKFVVK